MASLNTTIDGLLRDLLSLRHALQPLDALHELITNTTTTAKDTTNARVPRHAPPSRARQDQARYMTALRAVPQHERPAVTTKIRATKSVKAAIKAARALRQKGGTQGSHGDTGADVR